MKNRKTLTLAMSIAGSLVAWGAAGKECLVYFGTFTNASSMGIYVSRLDEETGRLSTPELAAATPSPNFLAVSGDGRFLYAATRVETFEGKKGGAVSSFSIADASGRLKLVDQKFSGGEGPCHVNVDAAGSAVFAANYPGGSVKSFRVDSDGRLTDGAVIQHHGSGPNAKRQGAAHAHCVVPAPAGQFALSCDLGADKVMIYRVNPVNAALTPNEPPFAALPPGTGPRHLAFSPDGKSAYVINELACTVAAFDWDGTHGALRMRQTVPLLPPGTAVTESFTAAEIAVRPDGRFVYGTVRGHESVTALAVDEKSGKLSFLENVPSGGRTPRGMGIDPTGRWLIAANQTSDSVTVFGISPASGRLKPTGQVLSVGAPVDVKFTRAR